MSDDNNQKSRGPRKGGGAGGRGGGKDGGSRGGGFGGAGRGPSRSAGPGGGERKPFRSRPEGAERPSRSAGEGSERPQRRFDKPAGARDGAPRPPREGGERPFRARPEGGDRLFRARPDGERSSSRPPRDGGKRFERPQRREEAAATPTVLASLLPQEPERIAKVMARAGVASRRDSEAMIAEGRVSVNGTVLESPALDIGPNDVVMIDGEPLPARERTRMWLYHKPRGLVTTNHDPEGRPTVFDALPEDLPRVLSIGRLDINTEGLLLLTNDGGLARMLELPETGWLRRYRVRAFGQVTQDRLDTLRDGVTIEGIAYGPIVARFERQQGSNTWLTVDLREGKNREVKTVLEHLGLDVNRLIRVSFGPFQLGDLPEGEVDEIRSRVLKDQLGEELMAKAGVDFEAPRRDEMPVGAAKVASGEARRAPSGDDRPRRREGGDRDRPGSDVVRTPSQDDRSEKPWKRTTWRDAEAEPQRERKAPPRRGADPKLERQTREASGEIVRRRDKAIADPSGRRVLVERVSSSRAERPEQDGVNPKRRPDRLPRNERGRADAAPARVREERASSSERPARRPRSDAGERDRTGERPWQDAPAAGERPQRAPRGDRPERAPREGGERPPRRFTERPGQERTGQQRTGEERPRGRSFGDKPGGAPKSYAARSSERPAGRKPGPGRSFGDKPGGGGKPFGGRPGGGGGRPGGGRPSGGKPGGGRPRSGGNRD
jgi:23S rRNA pseudouridine2605 synthase